MSMYDEIEIEDMTYDPTLEIYHYPCPCGDRFEIGIADLKDGEDVAVCPSCSLMIKVIFEVVSDAFYGRLASMSILLTAQDNLPDPAKEKAKLKEKLAKEQKSHVPVVAAA